MRHQEKKKRYKADQEVRFCWVWDDVFQIPFATGGGFGIVDPSWHAAVNDDTSVSGDAAETTPLGGVP